MAQIETEELSVARLECLEEIVNTLGDHAVNARKLGMTMLRVEIGKEGFVNLFPHYEGEQPDEPVPVHTFEGDIALASRAIHEGLKSFYSSPKPLTPHEESQLRVLMMDFMNLLGALSSSPNRLSSGFITFFNDTFFAQEGSSEESCDCSCRDDVDEEDKNDYCDYDDYDYEDDESKNEGFPAEDGYGEEDEEEQWPSFSDC